MDSDPLHAVKNRMSIEELMAAVGPKVKATAKQAANAGTAVAGATIETAHEVGKAIVPTVAAVAAVAALAKGLGTQSVPGNGLNLREASACEDGHHHNDRDQDDSNDCGMGM